MMKKIALLILVSAQVSDAEPLLNTSSTTYFGGDTAGTPASPRGACGGARPDQVRERMLRISDKLPHDYFPVAVSQQMMEQLDSCRVGEIKGAGYKHVLHAYCGQCIEFESKSNGATVGGLVLDICPPGGANSKWCQTGGKPNSVGQYNHIDFFGNSSTDVLQAIGDNPLGKINLVACPSALDSMMTELADAQNPAPSPVCNWYYDPNLSKWQGAYGMGKWGCSECGGGNLQG